MSQCVVFMSIVLYTAYHSVEAISSLPWIMTDPTTEWPTMRQTDDANRKQQFVSTIETELPLVVGSSDGELVDAIEHFFWHSENGIVIELGALDGTRTTNSQSEIFEQFGWKRILIEANPTFRDGLRLQHKSLAVSAAICSNEQVLHYAMPPRAEYQMTAGIVEFMAPHFMKQFHPALFALASRTVNGVKGFNASQIDWTNPSLRALSITPVACLPITRVLEHAQITHVNLFILDVEGAELSILDGIDFTRFTFDVLLVEKTHAKLLRDFFEKSDYELVADRGRNYWFKHKNFVASRRADVEVGCYRGCVKAGISGSKRAFCTSASLPIPQ